MHALIAALNAASMTHTAAATRNSSDAPRIAAAATFTCTAAAVKGTGAAIKGSTPPEREAHLAALEEDLEAQTVLAHGHRRPRGEHYLRLVSGCAQFSMDVRVGHTEELVPGQLWMYA
eukprot:3600176-Rhodomonas_salina.3